jgi:predicted nucleic-acid-binding protein
MRAVDTNLLVRLIAQDDAKQAEAAQKFVAGGAWISHLVLAESIWVLDSVFELPAASLATAIRMLLEHESLVVQDADVVAAALEHFTARPALGFSDCLMLEVARKAGHLPVGTFDRAFAKLDDVERI